MNIQAQTSVPVQVFKFGELVERSATIQSCNEFGVADVLIHSINNDVIKGISHKSTFPTEDLKDIRYCWDYIPAPEAQEVPAPGAPIEETPDYIPASETAADILHAADVAEEEKKPLGVGTEPAPAPPVPTHIIKHSITQEDIDNCPELAAAHLWEVGNVITFEANEII